MPNRIVVLTEGYSNPLTAKTAASVIRYRKGEVVAVLDSTQAGKTSQELLGVGGDIPVVGSLAAAPTADTLLVGIAPRGGRLPEAWRPLLMDAIERGMSIVAGLHDFLSDDGELVAAAGRRGVRLVDVRKNQERDVARQKDINPACLRIQTVGHDCNVGKMITAIEVSRALARAGCDSKFVATGQTGIMIEGDGCPIDCVVGDFINGAAEKLVLANQSHEVLLIEGQGSLFHPSYSAVTLGLLHGSLPDGLILCYEAGRTAVRGLEHVKLPPLARLRDVYETAASIMHPCRAIGVGLNSRLLTDDEAEAERERARRELGLPVCDVLRHGPDELVEAVIRLKQEFDTNPKR